MAKENPPDPPPPFPPLEPRPPTPPAGAPGTLALPRSLQEPELWQSGGETQVQLVGHEAVGAAPSRPGPPSLPSPPSPPSPPAPPVPGWSMPPVIFAEASQRKIPILLPPPLPPSPLPPSAPPQPGVPWGPQYLPPDVVQS